MDLGSQAYVNYINNVSNMFSLYFSGIAFTLGIVFNIISAIVFFTSKNLNKTRMGYLYGMLCLVDTLSLISNVLWIQFLPYIDAKYSFRLISDLTCKFNFFLNRTIVFTSSWLQCYISLDRWIDIRYPRRFKALSSYRTINLIIFGIIVAMCLIASENFFYTLTPSTKTTLVTNKTLNGSTYLVSTVKTTTWTCTSSSTFLFVAQIISATMRTWIPLVFLMVINVLTIRIMMRSRRRVSGSSDKQFYSAKERQFTVTVLTLNGIFFLLNFPLSIYWILNSIFNYFPTSVSARFLANLNLFYIISLSMAYFYHALTFFINIAFNSIFRQEIRRIVYRVVNVRLPDSSTGTTAEVTKSFKTNDKKSSFNLSRLSLKP